MSKPPLRPMPSSTAPSRETQYGPLIVGGAAALVVLTVALVLFVKNYLDAHQAVADVVGGLLIALVVAIILSAIGGLVAGVRWAVGRAGMVKPDEHGIIPVSRKAIRASGLDLQTLPAVQRTAYARAVRVIPDGVTSVSQSMLRDERPLEVIEPEIVDTPPQDVPPLSVLLRDGVIRVGQFCIGFDQSGRPIYGTYEEFCTIGDGGTMGTGKSNDGAFYLAQVLAVGGQGYVADPNAGHPQSLANYLGRMVDLLAAPVAKNPADILKLVQRVRRLLATRIDENDEGDIPVILLIDEFTAIMLDDDLAAELPKLLSIINTQGRKYGVFVFLLAQLWGAEMTGGTKVRNLLAGRICHNLPVQEARNLLGLPASAMPKDIGSLKRGEAYVRTLTGALHRVTIPLVDEEGVADLRKLVAAGGALPVSEGVSEGLRDSRNRPVLRVVPVAVETAPQSVPKPETKPGPDLSWWADATDHSPDYLRRMVRKLVGVDKLSLAAAIRQIDPKAANGGDRYTKALAAATEIIREGLDKEA